MVDSKRNVKNKSPGSPGQERKNKMDISISFLEVDLSTDDKFYFRVDFLSVAFGSCQPKSLFGFCFDDGEFYLDILWINILKPD